MTVSGFSAGAIPAGSVLESAALKITHRHSDATSTDKLDLSVDVGAGAPLTASVVGRPGSPAYQTSTMPLHGLARWRMPCTTGRSPALL
jgi:hypothetical protein